MRYNASFVSYALRDPFISRTRLVGMRPGVCMSSHALKVMGKRHSDDPATLANEIMQLPVVTRLG